MKNVGASFHEENLSPEELHVVIVYCFRGSCLMNKVFFHKKIAWEFFMLLVDLKWGLREFLLSSKIICHQTQQEYQFMFNMEAQNPIVLPDKILVYIYLYLCQYDL